MTLRLAEGELSSDATETLVPPDAPCGRNTFWIAALLQAGVALGRDDAAGGTTQGGCVLCRHGWGVNHGADAVVAVGAEGICRSLSLPWLPCAAALKMVCSLVCVLFAFIFSIAFHLPQSSGSSGCIGWCCLKSAHQTALSFRGVFLSVRHSPLCSLRHQQRRLLATTQPRRRATRDRGKRTGCGLSRYPSAATCLQRCFLQPKLGVLCGHFV